MPAQYEPPALPAVANLFSDLIGKPVEINEVTPGDAPSPAAVAVYSLDNGRVAAICVADIGLANYLGAALAMIPSDVAQENTRGGSVPEQIFENYSEVLNVASAWFRVPLKPRVTLTTSMMTSEGTLPDATLQALGLPGLKTEVAVTIAGYGAGRLIFFCPDYGDADVAAASPA